MRVLIVYPGIYIYGGAELLLVKLCNYLSMKGVYNALLTTSIIPEVNEKLKGTEIIIEKREQSKGLLETIKFPMFLYKSINKHINRFDVVNVHNYPSEFSSYASTKPVVWMCNEPELYLAKMRMTSFKKRLLWLMLIISEKIVVKNYIDDVIVSDDFNYARFKKIYNKIPHIVNYGIDYDYFSRGSTTESRGKIGLDNKFIILHVGMLTPFKNQIASLNTINELKNIIPNIMLILAGHWENEYKKELENYINKNHLEAFVIFTGHIDKEKLRDYYWACNVLLHPIKSQGGWLSPFEALCAERPIIVSHELTIANIIEKNKFGIVTDNFNDAIIEIYKKPDEYNKMAKYGKEWVKNNLSWDNFCSKTLDVFNQSVKGKKETYYVK
ncbi:MAG: glycosyltransferase family 4 protein [Candidatus Firestonebacteria bacterium]|nr:glycosyltransferase family 4 protein [Candidatus Firestonebacteria bacterium]